METPAVVLKEAKKTYGKDVKLRHLGSYDGGEAFTAILPMHSTLGFPEVYIYKGKKVETIFGPKSLDIIHKLSKE